MCKICDSGVSINSKVMLNNISGSCNRGHPYKITAIATTYQGVVTNIGSVRHIFKLNRGLTCEKCVGKSKELSVPCNKYQLTYALTFSEQNELI